MSIIVLPFTFSVGAVIIASQHNSNFSTIYSDYNGNIQNVNVASNAGIVYSKLSLSNSIQSTDILSSTVFSLANIPSPATVVGTFTYNVATASGTQTISGLGMNPKKIFLMGAIGGTYTQFNGLSDGTNQYAIATNGATNTNWNPYSSNCLVLAVDISNYQLGTIAIGTGQFVITWTKNGSPTGTGTMYYLAIG